MSPTQQPGPDDPCAPEAAHAPGEARSPLLYAEIKALAARAMRGERHNRMQRELADA